MKRGGLGSIDNEDTGVGTDKATTTPRRSTRQQRKAGSSRKKKGSNTNKSGASDTSSMSPDLAKFLDDGSSVEVGRRAPKTKTERREKQSAQKVVDEARGARIELVLEELQDVLGNRTGNVRDILTIVDKLVSIPSSDNSDLRRLLSARDRTDYRLAWVGSDDAICHLGTGLHKVPLARMQEVFMNCLGKNKIEILEIISLIGPFPNVKNILQGSTKITSGGGGGSEMQITMDRMFDGTGKEIMAGTDDNIRNVDLEVVFCDERAIVVVMPHENKNTKPFDDDGKRVLLFVREDDLDDKLEGYRVNELDLD